MIAHFCSKSRPCGLWKTCHWCGLRRQAATADQCEKLQARCGALRWHILYPADQTPEGLAKSRQNLIKRTAAKGAVWTIEQSKKTRKIHINIVTPDTGHAAPATGHYWSSPITGNVRHVGAYIAKRRQHPNAATFGGRCSGTSGRLWSWLVAPDSEPVVQAAATQYANNSMAMIEAAARGHAQEERAAYLATLPEAERNAAAYEDSKKQRAAKQEMTLDAARVIAARYLPDLLKAQRHKTTQAAELEAVKRAL